MPNIALLLRQEITRLARKELRANTEGLKKAVATYRSEIASLKRRIEVLESQVKRTARIVARAQPVAREEASETRHRFSAKGLANHRKRLGLSAADYGALLGASALSVYKWEAGQARPRARYLPAIAAVRKMGRREAAARLEKLAS